MSNTHRTPTITPPIYSRDTTVEPSSGSGGGRSRMTSHNSSRAHVPAAKPKPKVAESNVPNASHASSSKKAGGGERKPRDAAAPSSSTNNYVPRHVLTESRRQPRSDARHINVPAADLIQPLAASTRAALERSRDATKATNSRSASANSSFNYDYVAAALGRAMPLEGAMTQALDDDDGGGGGGGADDELNTSFADKLRLEEERRELTEKRARQVQERRQRVQKITELPPAVTQPKRVRVSHVTTQSNALF